MNGVTRLGVLRVARSALRRMGVLVMEELEECPDCKGTEYQVLQRGQTTHVCCANCEVELFSVREADIATAHPHRCVEA